MTFRSNDLSRKSTSLSYGDLQKGQKISGTIKKIEAYGLFIQIESSKLSGLCHKSEVYSFPFLLYDRSHMKY